MKRLLQSLCFAGVLFAGAGLSPALNIPASEDTTVASNKVTLAASKAPSLLVDPTHASLVYFNLDEIPKDAVVRVARLRFYLPSFKSAGVGIGVHRVTGQWDEVREATSPAYTTAAVATIEAKTLGANRFVSVDVTALVQSWITGSAVNEGFALTSLATAKPGVAGASVTIAAKEGAGLGMPAHLDIELVDSATRGPQGAVGPAGPQGPKGESGANGKSVLSGTAAPASTTGVIGDLYLNTATGALYGPKATTGWGTARSLVGPKGDAASLSKGTIKTENLSADTIQSILDAAVTAVKPMITDAVSVGVPSGLRLISAGSFQMGDDLDAVIAADIDTRMVYVSQFYMGETMVPYLEWKSVYDWAGSHGYSLTSKGEAKADDHPVGGVTWYDALKWCNARSEKEGLVPVYYVDAGQTVVYRSRNVQVVNTMVKWTANGYRLPTEAEFEKGARGGLVGKRFPWGNTISFNQANYCASRLYSYDLSGDPTTDAGVINPKFKTAWPYTSSVKYFPPNGYGLYDMAGNIGQWCWDLYGGYNLTVLKDRNDPKGAESTDAGTERVVRGGGSSYPAFSARCSRRERSEPEHASEGAFRVVRGGL